MATPGWTSDTVYDPLIRVGKAGRELGHEFLGVEDATTKWTNTG
jgi:hypothetical protein